MIKTLIRDFPVTDIASDREMTEEKIKRIVPHLCYTKEEVDLLIQGAVDEARKIDEESMKKHNRDEIPVSKQRSQRIPNFQFLLFYS